jgi:hypothetical protein
MTKRYYEVGIPVVLKRTLSVGVHADRPERAWKRARALVQADINEPEGIYRGWELEEEGDGDYPPELVRVKE